ncbi:MAG: hypothetical protein VX288_06180 [Planctomycetota bacterium]|nr:hypothetical protein [Planctomycetota bacterium]
MSIRTRFSYRRNGVTSRALVSRLALALGCLFFTSVKADVVVQSSGKRIEGVSISSAKWDQVLFKQGNNTVKLNGDKVASIQRDSAYLEPARSSLASGNYKKALSILDKLEGRGLKGWQAAELLYLKGKIYLESGESVKADSAFDLFVKTNRESKDYWLPHAIYGRGQAALNLGRGSSAQQHFKGLAPYGPTWVLRAKLGEAHGLFLAKKYVDARTKFQEVANDRKAPASLKVDALIGRIEVIASQKQYDKAIADLEKHFFAATAQVVDYGKARARASYLMGLSYKNLPGKENLEKAEIWLLKTAVLFRQHKSIYKDSCSALADVYKQLGRSERATEWGKRAEG